MERLTRADRTAAVATALAHDFNDELTVILSSVRSNLPADDKLVAVEDATLRCVVLTRRLLAFAERSAGHRSVPLDAVLGDLF